MGKLVNRAKMTVSGTPGTGAITLGAAASGYQDFATAGVADGTIVSYVIEDGTAWELGQGTYAASGPTLTRTTIQASSNAGGAISASSGAQVFITPLAGDLQGVLALVNAGITSATEQPFNMSIAASVASNALTIAVKGTNGSDPSASNPVLIPFRDPTLTTGDLVWVTLTAATAITIPSGATLGTLAGKPARIWVVAIYNSGAITLGVKVCTDGSTTIYPLTEVSQTATAIGTGATSAGVLYGTAAATGPLSILGFVEITEATAGTWASAPSAVRRHVLGGKRPGDIVQKVAVGSTTQQNNNINVYSGTVGISGVITPVSACNVIDVAVSGGALNVSGNNTYGFIRLTRDATGSTLAEGAVYIFASNQSGSNPTTVMGLVSLRALDWPASTAALTYKTQLKNADNATNVVYPQTGRAQIDIAELMV